MEELLKKVRKIEIKTKHLSQELFSGDYHSAFKGQGMSFAEVREYQFGDDVRSIDWNVTARTGKPHIKIFEEEREMTFMLIVDVSASVFTGRGISRHEFIAELCAVLSFSAIQNNDKVGMILFADEVIQFIPPKKGRKHILRMIRELLYVKPKKSETNIGEALAYFSKVIPKRSMAFVLSDFFSTDYEKALGIASRRHKLIALHISGAEEKEVPQKGIYNLWDPERMQGYQVDLYDKKIRENWATFFDDHSTSVEKLMNKMKAPYLRLFTHENYVPILHQFFGSKV